MHLGNSASTFFGKNCEFPLGAALYGRSHGSIHLVLFQKFCHCDNFRHLHIQNQKIFIAGYKFQANTPLPLSGFPSYSPAFLLQ